MHALRYDGSISLTMYAVVLDSEARVLMRLLWSEPQGNDFLMGGMTYWNPLKNFSRSRPRLYFHCWSTESIDRISKSRCGLSAAAGVVHGQPAVASGLQGGKGATYT